MIENNKNILIVGLGNPGYDTTVHNIGSILVQQQIKDISTSAIKNYYQSNTLLNIYYAFNLSNMNMTGEYIANIIKYKNIKHLIIVYDDIRVVYGKYRIMFGGSHTGHNGIKNIMQHCSRLLHNKDFYRIRIGAGPKPSDMDLSSYVLSKIHVKNLEKILSLYGSIWFDIYDICKKIISDHY